MEWERAVAPLDLKNMFFGILDKSEKCHRLDFRKYPFLY